MCVCGVLCVSESLRMRLFDAPPLSMFPMLLAAELCASSVTEFFVLK